MLTGPLDVDVDVTKGGDHLESRCRVEDQNVGCNFRGKSTSGGSQQATSAMYKAESGIL